MAVNLSPVGGVAAQFFTSTGAVLTGGKLYTYAAGTTTPTATYATSAGVTPWTNPIVLDAAGRVPNSGEIWLADGVQYKFVVKDSNDVLIATYDNITGINSNFVNYTNSQEIQTATAGQTVFTLTTMQYQPGTNSLSVFVDGVNQYGPSAQYAYSETDGFTVTFTSGLHVGASVKFTTSQLNASAATEAFQVGYKFPYSGSVATNVGAKLAQTVSIVDFGADPANDAATNAAAIQAAFNTGYGVYIPDGVFETSIVYPAVNQTVYGVGTLKGTGLTPVIEIATTRTGVVLRGFKIVGDYANQVNGNDVGILVNESGFLIDGLEISECAAFGIRLYGQNSNYNTLVALGGQISNCFIHDNGCGIETGPIEYVNITGNRINGNGLSYDKTGFASSGATPAGIAGGISNIAVTDNYIGENAYGMYITGSSGSNTDHNKINNNTINHNLAAGVVLEALKNYVSLIGNNILSNVVQGTAPSVYYPPIGSSVDLSLVDCPNLMIVGNSIGGGSYASNIIPLYGVGGCRWINNNLFACPTEMRAPQAGTPLYDTYGYTVNADNRFEDNLYRGYIPFDEPSFLVSSVRYASIGNIEATLGLVDDYLYEPTFAATWAQPVSTYNGVRYWREGGNRVRINGAFYRTTGSAATAFTLPVGFRPVGNVVLPYIKDVVSGAVGYIGVYANGDVVPVDATNGTPVMVDITFTIL